MNFKPNWYRRASPVPWTTFPLATLGVAVDVPSYARSHKVTGRARTRELRGVGHVVHVELEFAGHPLAVILVFFRTEKSQSRKPAPRNMFLAMLPTVPWAGGTMTEFPDT